MPKSSSPAEMAAKRVDEESSSLRYSSVLAWREQWFIEERSLTFIPVATAFLRRRLGASRDSESGRKLQLRMLGSGYAWNSRRMWKILALRGKALVANQGRYT